MKTHRSSILVITSIVHVLCDTKYIIIDTKTNKKHLQTYAFVHEYKIAFDARVSRISSMYSRQNRK